MDTTNNASPILEPGESIEAAAPAALPLAPLQRFANAVVRVLSSNVSPLAGHIRDELHASAEALGKLGAGAMEDVPSLDDIAALLNETKGKFETAMDAELKAAKDALGKEVERLTGEHNAALNAAVASVTENIKAAGDEQIAAIKAATAPPSKP